MKLTRILHRINTLQFTHLQFFFNKMSRIDQRYRICQVQQVFARGALEKVREIR